MINIRIGDETDKQQILDIYPRTRNVIGEGGYLIIAENESETVGFLWAFKRKIPAPIEQEELFINVIEVIYTNLRCQGIATKMLEEIKRIAQAKNVYQIRAYCEIGNISSHRLWLKNKFSINPVKMPDDTIAGSFVSFVL